MVYIQSMNDEDQIVMVPVPVHLLGQVYALLARKMEAPQSLFEVQAHYRLTPEEIGQRRFSAGELGLLKRSLDLRSGARTMLDLCASRPGELITFDEVVTASGLGPTQVRGQMGAMTKLLKKLFHQPEWPVITHWGVRGVQQASYEMHADVARMWNDLSGQ
jgi:hypothetical protein